MASAEHTDITRAKEAVFGPENPHVAEELQTLSSIIHGAIFRGIAPQDTSQGETIDRRLPFSESLERACFVSAGTGQQELTPFGQSFKECITGNTFIDLGCGGGLSHLPKDMAYRFGAERYVGVDKSDGFTERVEENGRNVYLYGDILETLVKLEKAPNSRGRLVLFLCGIELSRARAFFPGDPTNAYNDRYAEACHRAMQRIRPRAVVIGPGTSEDFRPDPAFFQKAATQEVQCNVGEFATGAYELWIPQDDVPEERPRTAGAGRTSPIEWAA